MFYLPPMARLDVHVKYRGTLRVLPFLSLTCAYMMLRPFFRPRSANSESLKSEDWEVDTTSAFPGTGLGGAQEFTEKTHPHLRLDKVMVSIPSNKITRLERRGYLVVSCSSITTFVLRPWHTIFKWCYDYQREFTAD
jgi:hypothetical protein